MFPSPSLQSQHQLLHPHPVSPPDLNPKMPCSSHVRRMMQAFMASVASGHQDVLPPIPPHKQPQPLSAACSSSYCSFLPAVVQGDPALPQLLLGERASSLIPKPGAPRPRGRRKKRGLYHAHPLEPLPTT